MLVGCYLAWHRMIVVSWARTAVELRCMVLAAFKPLPPAAVFPTSSASGCEQGAQSCAVLCRFKAAGSIADLSMSFATCFVAAASP